MTKKNSAGICIASCCILLLMGLTSNEARAQDQKPIQISLIAPVQLYPEDTAIKGLRLNLIYGKNESVTGLDIGLINAAGSFKGLQYGAIGITESEFVGWQNHFVNISNGSVRGAQTGLVNTSQETKGFQYGIVNHAGVMNGVQLGIVNYAGQMTRGLQVGFVNIISEGGRFPVFPVVNWSF